MGFCYSWEGEQMTEYSPRDGVLLFMGRWAKYLRIVSDSEFDADSENSYFNCQSRYVCGHFLICHMSERMQNRANIFCFLKTFKML